MRYVSRNRNFSRVAFLTTRRRDRCLPGAISRRANVQNAFAHVRTISFFTLTLQHMALSLAASLCPTLPLLAAAEYCLRLFPSSRWRRPTHCDRVGLRSGATRSWQPPRNCTAAVDGDCCSSVSIASPSTEAAIYSSPWSRPLKIAASKIRAFSYRCCPRSRLYLTTLVIVVGVKSLADAARRFTTWR